MKKIILFVSLIFILASCSQPVTKNNDSTVSLENNNAKISVITSIVPIAAIVNTIGWDSVIVENMVAPGVSPHDFDPSPKDLIGLEKADIIFYTGLEHIDGFLDRVIQNKNAVPLSEGVALLTLTSFHDHDEHAWEEHEDEHAWEKSNYSIDPHFWTSAEGALLIATKVRDELSLLLPEQSELFSRNYINFEKELWAVKQNFMTQVKGKEEQNFIIFHDAYSYLFQELAIDKQRTLLFQKSSIGSQNPAELQEFIDTIAAKNITLFFREPQFRKSQLENLTNEYNLEAFTLDPLGSSTRAGGYLENYKSNLDNLEKTYK